MSRYRTHRFVVATRHLSPAEVELLGSDTPRYQLQIFRPDDLAVLAGHWLGEDKIGNFLTAADQPGLAEMARIPLTATILCQLYPDNADNPLPRHRGTIYEAYVALSHSRRHAAGLAPERLVTASLERYDDNGTQTYARDVIKHLPEMVRWVAYRHFHDGADPLTAARAYPQATTPLAVLPGHWDEFLTACLVRTGVIEPRGATLVFTHRTLLEYLAASHVHKKLGGAAIEVRRLLRQTLPRHWPWSPVEGHARWYGWGLRIWSKKFDEDISYLGFLIDLAGDEVSRDLLRLTRRRGVDCCSFLANQARLGTYLPGEVQTAAADGLVRHMTPTRAARWQAGVGELLEHPEQFDPRTDFAFAETIAASALDPTRVEAAQALVVFDRERGLAMLRELARSRHLVTRYGQIDAATALLQLGQQEGTDVIWREGVDLLRAFANNPRFPEDHRIAAAMTLADHHPCGRDIIFDWTTGADLDLALKAAALLLIKLRDDRVVDHLARLADDPDADPKYTINAAHLLAQHGDHRGLQHLVDFAGRRDLPKGARMAAAWMLADVGDQRGDAIYRDLATDPDLNARRRWYARRETAFAVLRVR